MNIEVNENIQQHFDEYAITHEWQSYYEKGLNSGNCNFHLRFNAYKRIVEQYSPETLLDLGCGSGDFLSLCINSETMYHGVDFSKEMIASVNQKIQKLPEEVKKRFSCEQGTVESMKNDVQYDFVLASGLLEYFEDLKPVATIMHQSTKSGGLLAVQVPNSEYYRWHNKEQKINEKKNFLHHRITKDECDSLFTSLGYRLVKGHFVNHIYFPLSLKFPKLYVFLSDFLGPVTPEFISRRFASMYIGVYQK